MKIAEEGVLLRIFIGKTDSFKSKPLYEQIVLKARELKLAGATVIRGIMLKGMTLEMLIPQGVLLIVSMLVLLVIAVNSFKARVV